MKRSRIWRTAAWVTAAAVLLALIIWTIWGNTALELNRYTLSDESLPTSFEGYRIAHVSDLHNAEFGQDNAALIDMLRTADPDIIAVTGDLIDSRNTDVAVALRFIEQAADIAPVYYITGNHESRIPEDYAALKAGMLSAGVTVLDNARITLTRNGEHITLLGMPDPGFSSESPEATLHSLTDGVEGFTLLLAHHPEMFDTYVACGIDLALTGHAHGGQFRLPFVGGLIAPGQGFFPQYDAGLYTEGDTAMLVSRGIGNSIIPIRFNNRPEVILIELSR